VKVGHRGFERRRLAFDPPPALDPYDVAGTIEPEPGFDWTHVDRIELATEDLAAGQTVHLHASRLELRRPKEALYLGLALAYLALGIGGVLVTRGVPGAPTIRGAVAIAIAMYPVVVHQTFKTQDSNFRFKYTYAQHYLVGEWLRENAKPGDKVLAVNQHIIQYASGLGESYFDDIVAPYSATTREAFIDELRERGITYLVWDNDPLEPTMYTGRLFQFLSDGVSYPHFRFVRSVAVGPKRAYVYRFEP